MPDLTGLPLRAVADAAGRPLDEVYRLFRLPSAPAPVAHVASVPVYEPRAAFKHVLGDCQAAEDAVTRLADRLAARMGSQRGNAPV